MSGVRDWFGNNTAKKQEDTPKNAIVGLSTQLEILRNREKHLITQVEEQDVIARKKPQPGIADRESSTAAKAALRRKKAYEHSLDQTAAQTKTLDLLASPERPIVERPSKKGPQTPAKKPLQHNIAHRPGSRGVGLRKLLRNWLAA
ncbi:hypothetical protein F4680DRAFT_451889 [Xylaria scruposa]|nr:hypothetical protein F4680DRAFT_451889 [Xylaria scruposa]